MTDPHRATAASRPRWPAQRIRQLVERCPEAPRPVAWWALIESVFARGFALGAAIVTVVVAGLGDAVGLLPLDVTLPAGAVLVAVALAVDLARLARWWRIARHGVLVTATVTDDAPGPARTGQRRARRLPHPRGGTVSDHTRVPDHAPHEAFAQSVLVAPARGEVWLTLTAEQPLDVGDAPGRRAGGALAARSPLTVVTGWGRATAAWRAGLAPLFAGFILAPTVAEATGHPAGWLVALAGPLLWVVAARRVALRVDQRGVVVRSSLWTRSRPWDRLERLTTGEVVILAGKFGSAWTASVLAFHDDLGVRLEAVATVRCWNDPRLSELVDRCEAAGVTVDDEVRPTGAGPHEGIDGAHTGWTATRDGRATPGR